MKKSILKIHLLIILFVLLASSLPILAIAETIITSTAVSENNMSATKSDNLSDDSNESEELSISDNEQQSNHISELKTVTTPTGIVRETEQRTVLVPQAKLNDELLITSWDILDSDEQALSESNPAKDEARYALEFSWEVTNLKGTTIQPGDYFTMPLPVNKGKDGAGSNATGSWSINPGVRQAFYAADTTTKIGEWYIDTAENNEKQQAIYVQFTEGIMDEESTIIIGENFNTGKLSLTNYNEEAGLQYVEFGNGDGTGESENNQKIISFQQQTFEKLDGFVYNSAEVSDNNSLYFSIPVNEATSVELAGGQYVEEASEGIEQADNGWYYQANQWGQVLQSNPTDMYVENVLDSGIEVASLTINTQIAVPTQLDLAAYNSIEDDSKYLGGAASNVNAYEQPLLNDDGDGPTYDSQGLTEEHSFIRFYQKAKETKEEFKQRLFTGENDAGKIVTKSYRYGIYNDGDQLTVMAYFGDMTNDQSEGSLRLSDLTTNKTAANGRRIVVENQRIPILQFAVEAADNTIANGYYSEEYREMLEDYYTITYGDTNAVSGQIPTFKIGLALTYPSDEPEGEKSNRADFYHDSTVEQVTKGKEFYSATGTGYLNNSRIDATTELEQEKDPAFTLLKKDDQGNLMPSYNQAGALLGDSKQVSFDVYRFNGSKNKDPEEVPIESDSTEWTLVKTNVLTDTAGAIKLDDLKLAKNNGKGITYGLVETTTYKDYQVPEDVYWVVYGKMKKNGQTAYINSVVPVDKTGGDASKYVSDAEDGEEIALINYLAPNQLNLYKVDKATNQVMPSKDIYDNDLESGQKVTFDLYRWKSSGAFDETILPDNESCWEKVDQYTTDVNGRLTGSQNISLGYDGEIYALVETSTYTDHYLPTMAEGYWVIKDNQKVYTYGRNNPGTTNDYQSIGDSYTKDTRIIFNDYQTDIKLYKSDADSKALMPSTTEKQVAFRYYQYLGEAAGATDFETSLEQDSKNWLPLANPAKTAVSEENQYLFETDSEGSLTQLNELLIGSDSELNDDKQVKQYALQEVSTYQGYKLDISAYWLVTLGRNNQTNLYEIKSVDYKSSTKPNFEPILLPDDEGNQARGYYNLMSSKASLKKAAARNMLQEVHSFTFTTENLAGTAIQGVTFDLYSSKAGIDFPDSESETLNPENGNSYWETASITKATSINNGNVTFSNLAEGHYLLVETSTPSAYQLPQGDWIIEIDSGGDISISARYGTSPPAFYQDEADSYHLPNFYVFKMPQAGGDIIKILLILGIVLIGLGCIYGIKQKNKKLPTS